jgi:endonuclease/exonuclease/phosphatase family metal-dependent hydrolase
VSQGNDTRLINIAVFSRYPIASLVSHRNDTFTSPTSGATYRFTRDCLELEIDVEGVRWAILAVHFISKSGGDASDDRRLAEAARVRALVDARLAGDPRARVLVAGDLNDQPGSPALVRLLGSGDTALADVSAGLAPEVRYTYVFSGRRELIDFILASPEAVSSGVETWIVHDGSAAATSDHAPVRARFLPPP